MLWSLTLIPTCLSSFLCSIKFSGFAQCYFGPSCERYFSNFLRVKSYVLTHYGWSFQRDLFYAYNNNINQNYAHEILRTFRISSTHSKSLPKQIQELK